MKKIAFAIQVFGIVAMFPLCFFLELNHGTGEAIKKRSNDNVTAKSEKPGNIIFVNAEAKNIKDLFYLDRKMDF